MGEEDRWWRDQVGRPWNSNPHSSDSFSWIIIISLGGCNRASTSGACTWAAAGHGDMARGEEEDDPSLCNNIWMHQWFCNQSKTAFSPDIIIQRQNDIYWRETAEEAHTQLTNEMIITVTLMVDLITTSMHLDLQKNSNLLFLSHRNNKLIVSTFLIDKSQKSEV